MNLNKFTEKAQEAILGAQHLAEEANHPQIEPEHLLAALVDQQEGIVPELLRKLSVNPAVISGGVHDALTKMPSAYGGSQPGLSPRLKRVTDLAQSEARRLKDDYVSTEHLFLAIAADTGRFPAALLLQQHGIT